MLDLRKSSIQMSEIILGGQDGLVNVLGVVLGIVAANGSQEIIIAAALAATFAEAISMGAVSYTSQHSQQERYEKQYQNEIDEVKKTPLLEEEEIRNIYRKKGFNGILLEKIVRRITANQRNWVDTMMKEELQMEPINKPAIIKKALVVTISAAIGSIIPILPFLFLPKDISVVLSIIISGVTLFAFGAFKAKVLVGVWWKSGIQMTLIGLGAALVGFIIGKFFEG